jgi:prepilin-type N-terminal cleavage/methylation domain-containing protein
LTTAYEERGGLDPSSSEHGFSLIEVMVAAVVAVIAVLGLAYSFSAGRGLIDRYAAARDALEAAQGRLDFLAMEAVRDPAAADLTVGVHGPTPRVLNHNLTGTEKWTVIWVDDPVDNGLGDADPNDYKRVTVEVAWQQGGLQDRIRMSRTFLGP